MAAVYGPKAAAMRKEDPERAVVEIIWRAKNGLPGNRIFPFSYLVIPSVLMSRNVVILTQTLLQALLSTFNDFLDWHLRFNDIQRFLFVFS